MKQTVMARLARLRRVAPRRTFAEASRVGGAAVLVLSAAEGANFIFPTTNGGGDAGKAAGNRKVATLPSSRTWDGVRPAEPGQASR